MSIETRRRRGTAFWRHCANTGDEHLGEHGDATRRKDVHLDHFVKVATRARELWLSSRQVVADALFDREWDNLRAAHSWAVATRNLDAARELVHATGPHAWCRARHEHGEWAARTLTLGAANGGASPITFAWAAYWRLVRGDYRGAIEVARRGIDVAAAPEHKDAVLCWTTLVRCYSASGDASHSRQSVRAAQAAAATNGDLFAQVTAEMVLIEDALENRLAAADGYVRTYRSRTERIGAPSLLARGALYQCHLKLRARPDPDANGALAAYRYGLELARGTGDINQENLMLWVGVYAATRLRTTDAGVVCRDALMRFKDTRYWHLALMVFDHMAAWLVATGQLEAAAVVLGYLDRNYPAGGEAGAQRRSRGRTAVRLQPGAAQLTARGADMDRDKLVDFVLDQLAMPHVP